MAREILPVIFKMVDSKWSGSKPQVNIVSFLFRVPIEIHAHHYNWTAQAYCCLDHWMTGCGFIPLRWEEWEFFSKWYPWNTITDQFDQWLTIVDFFYHSLAFKFRSPKPSFKHSIQLQLYLGFVKYLIHKLVDYTEARQGPKRINIWHYMFKVCCSDLIIAYTKHPLNFKSTTILEFIIEIFNFCQNLKSWISLLNILSKIISATVHQKKEDFTLNLFSFFQKNRFPEL